MPNKTAKTAFSLKPKMRVIELQVFVEVPDTQVASWVASRIEKNIEETHPNVGEVRVKAKLPRSKGTPN